MQFLGWDPHLDARLSRTGILLATARNEPLGLTVLEAMAHGVPVIATDAGGHRETVGAVERTYTTPPADRESMAQGLVTLASSVQERQRYGEALRQEQRRNFNLARHSQEVLRLYQQALGGEPKSVAMNSGRG